MHCDNNEINENKNNSEITTIKQTSSTKTKASLQCDGKIDSSNDNKSVTFDVANQTRFIGDNGELWCIGPLNQLPTPRRP